MDSWPKGFFDERFPEIYGDSVTYCDPLDVASIADVLYRLLTDGQLRDRVRMAGLERSGRYTWQSTAAVARRAYESLQASHRPEAVA